MLGSTAAGLARCQEELAGLRPGAEAVGEPPEHLEQLEQELRRGKLTLVSVEAQRRLVEVCYQGEAGRVLGAGQDQHLRLKQQCKALKSEVQQEREQHERLCRQLAEARRELASRQAAGERDAALLVRLAEEEQQAAEEQAAQGLAAPPDEDVAAMSAKAAEDAKQAGALLESGLSEEATKRRRADEEEYVKVRKTQRTYAATRAELERLEARERDRVEALEQLAAREAELGLPDIRFDSRAGTVTLVAAGGGRAAVGLGSVAQELRTVHVAFDGEGRLTKAEANSALGLWQESCAAVEEDDLARLMTRVRERLCAGELRRGAGLPTAAGA